MLDLLVIGAGLSGLTAALVAADAGQRVRVIATGMGSLHWTPGTLDLLGYLPDGTPVDTPLAAHRPTAHGPPAASSRCARGPIRAGGVGATPGRRRAVLCRRGWRRQPAPAESGRRGPAYLSGPRGPGCGPSRRPRAHAHRRLPRDARPLSRPDRRQPRPPGPRRPRPSPAADAHHRPPRQQHRPVGPGVGSAGRPPRSAGALRAVVAPGERIGLPAILGLDRHAEVWAELQDRVGAPIFEIPTLPPGVPGIRLYRALGATAGARGVRIEANMTAVDFGVEQDRIAWVATATSARPLRHSATNVLLATGGILGGGFNSDATGRVWETIFDLPLTAPQDRAAWFDRLFLSTRGPAGFRRRRPGRRGFPSRSRRCAGLRQPVGRGQPARPRRRHPHPQPGSHRRRHRDRRGAGHARAPTGVAHRLAYAYHLVGIRRPLAGRVHQVQHLHQPIAPSPR